MINVRLVVKNQREWDELWQELGHVAVLSSAESEKVADAVRRGIAVNFQHERGPNGEPWPPLAHVTQLVRRSGMDARGVRFSTGVEHPILRRTDDLFLSVTDPRHPRHSTKVSRGDDDTDIVVGAEDAPDTPDRIEMLHAGGVTKSGYIVPPRPFMGLNTSSEELVYSTTHFVLDQRVRRIG